MVQGVTGGHERALELTQIDKHSSLSIWLATHRHFSTIGMTMNAAARFRFNRTLKGVCGFKPELLAEFIHHGIRISLCVWRLTRHCGWERQSSTAAAVLATRSGPSIGCNQKCLKQ